MPQDLSSPGAGFHVHDLALFVHVADNHDLEDAHPLLQARFRFCVAFLRARVTRPYWLAVTSVKRDSGTHAVRGDGEVYCIDFDVEGLESDPEIRQALSELKGLTQLLFPYGVGLDDKWHFSFVWETDDAHRNHVHLQLNWREVHGPPS